MDNYEKGEELGKGQFGIVFKAKDKRVSTQPLPKDSVINFSPRRMLCSSSERSLTITFACVQNGDIVAIKKIRLGLAKEVHHVNVGKACLY